MNTLNVLMIDDSQDDAEFVVKHLYRGGFQIFHTRVCDARSLREALNNGPWDIVISDHTMSHFNGPEAFSIVRSTNADLPFLIVSDIQGEDTAVQMMKIGVHDYLLKSKLDRLVEVVKRELLQANDRMRLREKDEQLLQSQKIELMGKLASGIAHDFNNTLAVTNLCCDNILARKTVDADTLKEVRKIKESCDRATVLTRQLLAFSRKQILNPRVLNINPIIKNLESILGRIAGENILLKTDLNAGLAHTEIDPGYFEQAVMNLAVNAKEAMPDGGRLTLRTENIEMPTGDVIPTGSYVLLSVTDSGPGIEKRVLTKIFEPFFTTKDRQKSNGLGLSTVQGIIMQSGGYVTVDSQMGVGTTFHIYLPKCEAKENHPDTPTAQNTNSEETSLAGKKVLILEDEVLLSDIICDMLRQQSCVVSSAGTSIDINQILNDQNLVVDIVISDVNIPEVDGFAFLQKITQRLPGLKIILISGHMDNELEKYYTLSEKVTFLQKPFGREDLVKKVVEVLN